MEQFRDIRNLDSNFFFVQKFPFLFHSPPYLNVLFYLKCLNKIERNRENEIGKKERD